MEIAFDLHDLDYCSHCHIEGWHDDAREYWRNECEFCDYIWEKEKKENVDS